jgi:hypothetical protein
MRMILVAALLCGLCLPAAALDVPANGFVVSSDISQLPKAVQEKRAALLDAAVSGDMGKLKAIFDAQAEKPTVSFGEPEDPIAYLKEQSGDGDGLEVLAILADTLETPFAAQDAGDGKVYYIWPYFAAMEDFRVLTPAQLVEGYRLLGWRGFEDMREYGGWLNWRAYIDQDGTLSAFVAGD